MSTVIFMAAENESGEHLQQGRVSERDNCPARTAHPSGEFHIRSQSKKHQRARFALQISANIHTKSRLHQAEIEFQTRHCEKQNNETIISLQITCSKEGVPPRQEGARVPQGIVPTVGGSRFYSVNQIHYFNKFRFLMRMKRKTNSLNVHVFYSHRVAAI